MTLAFITPFPLHEQSWYRVALLKIVEFFQVKSGITNGEKLNVGLPYYDGGNAIT